MIKLKSVPYNVLSEEAYIIYLRKSRSDNPDESVEEVLEKHEEMLQQIADNIYREYKKFIKKSK